SQETLRQIVEKVDEYKSIKKYLSDMERSFGEGMGSLTTTLEGIATKKQIRGNLESLRERPFLETDYLEGQVVEVKLSKVTLPELVSFLHEVENSRSGFLKVTRIEIRSLYSNRALVDVSCEIASLVMKKEV
ncbi:MAG: hypothetical protein Q7S00_04505, partial [bacterium]|nr:hypothetical protein [bacterium]